MIEAWISECEYIPSPIGMPCSTLWDLLMSTNCTLSFHLFLRRHIIHAGVVFQAQAPGSETESPSLCSPEVHHCPLRAQHHLAYEKWKLGSCGLVIAKKKTKKPKNLKGSGFKPHNNFIISLVLSGIRTLEGLSWMVLVWGLHAIVVRWWLKLEQWGS